MQQSIIPDKQTVELCLKNRSYNIDFYQREYIWKRETVEILLRDIFYVFELSYAVHKDEDLTPEILSQYNWYYLNIYITNNINGKTYIVDGQQRLTTLTLIAIKLYHLTTDKLLQDTLRDCISGRDKWKGNIYCIDHEKRKRIMDMLLDGEGNINNCEFYNRTEKNLVERYKDISKYIEDKKLDDTELKAFINYFLERLVLVELSISQEDTPMIFEVINDRGEVLKPFEILKGKLIGVLSKNETESYSQKWDTALNRLHNVEDAFFRDYIKSRFIFKRNSKLEESINNSYHRFIFESNEIADALSFRHKDTKRLENIKNFINKDLEYYSTLYAKLLNSTNEFLRYNTLLSFSNQYQIIMSACHIDDVEEDKKISALSKEYDRLYVLLRLNLVYDSNKMQEISYALNEKVKNAGIEDYRGIFNEIIIQTITESRNVQQVTNLLDYASFLRADYSNLDTRFIRYFLARIENFLCDELSVKMQNDVDYIVSKTGYKTGYHIEHILSHNDTNLHYFDTESEFEIMRNRLGGLLLLKGRDNISSGNEEYTDKLKTYSVGLLWGHCLCEDFYHTNKSLDDLNKKLLAECGETLEPIKEFDKNALEARSKLLFQLVKIIWEF